MTLKLNGTNSEAAPAYAGDDADTGLQCGTNELKLVTGGTARATVDSSGQVGVGLTSPSSLLHLKSTSFPQLTVERDGSGTQGAGLKLVDGSGDENRIFTTDSSIVFDTGASSTPLARFQSGGGISFGNDTAAANALSDYEEGTFTVTYVPESGSFTAATYAEQNGSYTKIGNRLFFNLRIRTSGLTKGSAGGDLKISGLPYDVINDSTNGRNAISISIANEWAGDVPSGGHCQVNSDDLFLLYRDASDGSALAVTVADMGTALNKNQVWITGSYRVS